jgi:predicted TPR repeat methyltransferase
VEFKEFSHHMKGIDISPGMIRASMQRGIYNDLEENEILAALVKHQNDTDVMVSADVFVYVGDLESVFLAVTSALKENGLFLFSVESHEGDENFKLPVTARFTHSKKYIQELAKRRGLELLECKDTVIRTESGSPVDGFLVALKKTK